MIAVGLADKLNKSSIKWVDLGLVVILIVFLIFSFFFPYETPLTPSSPPPAGDKTKADNLYTNIVIGRTPDWRDTFNDAAHSRKENGWTFYAQPKLGCQLIGNGLITRSELPGAVADCYATTTKWNNFAYQVRVTELDGKWGGIVFRASNPNPRDALYRFGINPVQQTFQLLIQNRASRKNPVCNRAQLRECFNPIIQQHGENTLTVIAQGYDLYFYVNKVFVDQITDSTNASGLIGVYSYDDDSPCTTRFEDAKVWVI